MREDIFADTELYYFLHTCCDNNLMHTPPYSAQNTNWDGALYIRHYCIIITTTTVVAAAAAAAAAAGSCD